MLASATKIPVTVCGVTASVGWKNSDADWIVSAGGESM